MIVSGKDLYKTPFRVCLTLEELGKVTAWYIIFYLIPSIPGYSNARQRLAPKPPEEKEKFMPHGTNPLKTSPLRDKTCII